MNNLQKVNRFVIFLLGLSLAAVFKLFEMSFSGTTQLAHYSLLPFCLISIALIGWYVGRMPAVLAAWIIAIGWYATGIVAGPAQVAELLNHFFRLMYSVLFVLLAIPVATFLEALHKAKDAAWKDELTGVMNAKYFLKRASTEVSRATRYKRTFTIAYICINGLPDLEKRLGSKEVKAVLPLTADTLTNHLRSVDLVGRVEDTQFSVLLPETGYEQAQIVVPRVHQALSKAMQQNNWSLTFAVCAIACSQPPLSLEQLLAAVKAELDNAKEGQSAIIYKELGMSNTLPESNQTSRRQGQPSWSRVEAQ